jgi:hypothetical protein
MTLLVLIGYGSPALGLLALLVGVALPRISSAPGVVALGVTLVGGLPAAVRIYRSIRGGSRGKFMVAAEVLTLVILPLWGLAYSHFLASAECTVSACHEGDTEFRPLAEPEVYGLIGLHAATALAYVVSRRRPGALRPAVEALVAAALLVGMLAHGLLAVHFGRWAVLGVVLAPVFLPCASPLITILLYGSELRARLRRRGQEADAEPSPAAEAGGSPYRAGEQATRAPEPRVHVPTLARALALSPAMLGAYAVIEALRLGRPDAAVAVFTRTCGHVLSGLPVVVTPGDCHYLCTVAARGHGWLVKPERLGKRGGVTIVVNRQLAVANAFEDLLHERWPRFGRLARSVYDRLGLPISRLLHRPWLADLTYLAMKPAEWLFYGVLLLLDRGEPEARIDRMYR